MNGPAFVKVAAKSAVEICAQFQLDKSARGLLTKEAEPRDFLEALLDNHHYLAAIDFLAHALPAREAVWWGCLCWQHACGDSLSRTERTACQAAVVWVMRPGEETRAAAKTPGQLAGYASPAGALAIAANQTGGSLAPANYPCIPPSPHAPAKAVAQSIKSASLKGDPLRVADRQRSYAVLGTAIAEGKYV